MKRILFLGDSLVEYGDWRRLLPEFSVINRGISGETLAELSVRIADELGAHPGAEALVLQSGTNDLWNGNPAYPAIYRTLLPRLRLLLESDAVPVILCGLAPVSLAPPDTIAAINDELREIAAGVANCRFLDMREIFAAATDGPLFESDGVHFTDKGYAAWAGALAGCLAEAL